MTIKEIKAKIKRLDQFERIELAVFGSKDWNELRKAFADLEDFVDSTNVRYINANIDMKKLSEMLMYGYQLPDFRARIETNLILIKFKKFNKKLKSDFWQMINAQKYAILCRIEEDIGSLIDPRTNLEQSQKIERILLQTYQLLKSDLTTNSRVG